MRLDRLLTELSGWVWRFLDDAERAGFQPREDTVTEQLLVGMATQAGNQIRVHKTTGAEEADSGADFAWAIEVLPSRWLALLVQAKKLDHGSGRYEELRKSKAITQAQHLVAQARASSAVGLYLFYNGQRLGADGDQLWYGGCTRQRLMRAHDGPPWRCRRSPAGCTLVPAQAVLDQLLRGGADRPSSLSGVASPWECLLCPFVGGGGRPAVLPWPEWAPAVGPVVDLFDVPWMGEQPPNWAARLLEREDPTGADDAPDARYFVALRNDERD